jgi:translation initiation factor 6 (eIF-6)
LVFGGLLSATCIVYHGDSYVCLCGRTRSNLHDPTGVKFENSDEIGVFASLTNSYCLVGIGASESFYSAFEGELADHIPVVHASIAGCRIVGRLTVGNKNGLLVPSTTTDLELQHLRNSLPASVKVRIAILLNRAAIDARHGWIDSED